MNWLNKRNKYKGFNDKELFLLMYESLFLVKLSLGGEFAKDKKFFFVNVQNGKVSSQYQNIRSLKIYITHVIQLLNPKLKNVTLNCTIFIFDVNIKYFTGKNYIRIGRNTHQYLH